MKNKKLLSFTFALILVISILPIRNFASKELDSVISEVPEETTIQEDNNVNNEDNTELKENNLENEQSINENSDANNDVAKNEQQEDNSLSENNISEQNSEPRVTNFVQPNSDSDILNAGKTNPQQSVDMAQQNFDALIAAQTPTNVSTWAELKTQAEALSAGELGVYALPATMSFDSSFQTINIAKGQRVVITSQTTNTVVNFGVGASSLSKMLFYVTNGTLDLNNLTMVGTLPEGAVAAQNLGTTGPTPAEANITNNVVNALGSNTIVNIYNNIEWKNQKVNMGNYGAFISVSNNAQSNMYGGKYHNILAYAWGGTANVGLAGSQSNYFLGEYYDQWNTANSGPFDNYESYSTAVQRWFGTSVHDNYTKSNGASYAFAIQGNYGQGKGQNGQGTQQVWGNTQIHDNYLFDSATGKVGQKCNWGALYNADYATQTYNTYPEAYKIYNPTNETNVWVGQSDHALLDTYFKNNPYGGANGYVVLAEIVYTDPNLEQMYANNGIAEGIYGDWSDAYSGNGTVSTTGAYRIVEKQINNKNYAVIVNQATDLTINGVDVTDSSNPINLYTNGPISIASQGTTTLDAQSVDGYIITGAKVVSNDGNGISASTALTPVYGTDGTTIVGFELDPQNTNTGISNMTIEIDYKKPDYTVVFDPNKGSGSTEVTGTMNDQKIVVGVATPLETNAYSREGYTFNGWNTKPDGSGVTYTDGQDVTNLAAKDQSITLYAQWTPITYTIVYDKGSEPKVTGSMPDQIVTFDQTTYLEENQFENPGFHCIGWSLSDGGALDYDLGADVTNIITVPNQTITLYPVWDNNHYSVAFNQNKGTGSTEVTGQMSDQQFIYGVRGSLTPNKYTREGYTFSGWNTKADGSGTKYKDKQQVYNLTTEENGVVTLYAQWTPNTYKINFNANGANGSMSQQTLTVDAAAELENLGFSKDNYTFGGWATSANGPKVYDNQQEVLNLTYTKGEIIQLYAIWIENDNYNVVYDNNYPGQTPSSPQKVYVGNDYTINTQAPTRTGYTFLGYNTNPKANVAQYTPGQVVSGGIGQNGQTITLYAIWQANQYEVVFDKNAANAQGSMNNQQFVYDQPQTLEINQYTNEGYTFAGWATSANGNVVYADGQEVSNLVSEANGIITLYAVWSANTYTVEFDANTGTGTMKDQSFTYDQAQKLSNNTFTKDGYTFSGWNTSADGTGTSYTNKQEVVNLATSGTVTLYAQWSVNTYTVKFDANTGTGTMKDQLFTYDQPQNLSTNTFTKDGYTFSGWNTSADGTGTSYTDGQEVNNLTTTPNGTVTLYAQWSANTYTVKFDANTGNGTMKDQSFTYDQAQKLDANSFTKDGYTFSGWNTSADGTGTTYTNEQKVVNLATSGTVTLYAQWSANAYTVKFDANTGNGTMPDQTFTYNQPQNLSTNSFTKDGYTFSGWNTSADGTGTSYTDGQEVNNLITTPNGTVTLYAQWSANTYTVKFDANTGNGTMNDQSFTYDQAQKLEANAFTKDGYTFSGWNTSADGTGTSYTNKQEVTNLTTSGTVTLYAQWSANTYTVKFDANTGNGTMPDQTFTYDKTQKLDANTFTKDGYTFSGWNTSADGTGTSYTNKQEVTNLTTSGTVTLYAQWSANTYTVVFDANTGNGTMPDQTFTYDQAQKLDANAFTKDGYTFSGWNTSADGTGTTYTDGEAVNNLTTTPNGTVTLYAQWSANTYTVKFDANTGNGTMPDQTFTYDQAQKLDANAFTKVGYTFSGWNTSADGTGTSYTDGQEIINLTTSGTVTLYAIWQANEYEIIFEKNDPNATGNMPHQRWTYDSTFTLDSNTFKNPGFIFAGWSKDPNGPVEYQNAETISNNFDVTKVRVAGNVTLYAQWQKQTSAILPGPDGQDGTDDDVTVEGDPVVENPNGGVTLPNGGTVTPGVDGEPTPVPGGSVVNPDGSVILPDGGVEVRPNPDGSITLPGPDGLLPAPNDNDNIIVDGDGSQLNPDGSVTLPNGGTITPDNGNGKPIQVPGGSTVAPDGVITLPDKNPEAGFDNDNTVQIKPGPNGSIIIPGKDHVLGTGNDVTVKPGAGSTIDSNGNINLPNGGVVETPDGTINAPAGSTVLPDGTVIDKNGNILNPDGSITLPGPDGAVPAPDDADNIIVAPDNGGKLETDDNGNVIVPDQGATVTPDNGNGKPIQVPGGSTVAPDGVITLPDKNPEAGFDNDNTVQIKPGPDGSIIIPGKDHVLGTGNDVTVKPGAGSTIDSNGNINLPNGGVVETPDGTINAPAGSTVLPDGTVIDKNGNILNPDGSITVPGPDKETGTNDDVTIKPGENGSKPTINPDGSVNIPNNGGTVDPDGTITLPGEDKIPGTPDDVVVKPEEGATVNPDGSVDLPNGGTVTPGVDGEPTTVPGGSVVNPDGSVILPDGGVEVRPNPDGSITLPGPDGLLPAPNDNDNIVVGGNGSQLNPDGSVDLPNGGTVTPDNGNGEPIQVPGGSTVAPDGVITLPDKNPEAGFDNDNTVQIKPGPDGSIIIPGKDHVLGTGDDVTVKPGAGSTIDSNGNINLPNGGVVETPDGTINAPAGSTVLPDGTVIDQNGNILNPDGSITHPGIDGKPGTGDDIIIKPGVDGSKPTINPDGSVNIPEGGVVNPDGTITLPGQDGEMGTNDDVNITPNGPAIVNPDGSVTLPQGGIVNIGSDCQITVLPGGVVKPNGVVINPGANGIIDTPPYNTQRQTNTENDDEVLDPNVVCAVSTPEVKPTPEQKPTHGQNTGLSTGINLLVLFLIISVSTLVYRRMQK